MDILNKSKTATRRLLLKRRNKHDAYNRIAEWNANGFMKNFQELIIFLKKEKIYYCSISETHFTKETHIKIKGYQIYHTIHPSNIARRGSSVKYSA